MNSLKERVKEINNSIVLINEGSQSAPKEPKNDETLMIEPWGRDGLRVRSTVDAQISDTRWALTESVELITDVSIIQIQITDSEVIIRNGKISARISDIRTQKGYIQFFKHNGNEKVSILQEKDYIIPGYNPGTRIYKPIGKNLNHTEVHFESCAGEHFYGLGLNDTGVLNLKGCMIDLYQRHMKQVVPFLVSSQGYGFLWNNPSLGRVELGKDRTRWVSEGCRKIDYYITVGDGYGEIMEHYADVTGHAQVMPYWATGFWQCKLRYKTQEELLETAREFKRQGLPLSVIVIDFLHWKHTGDWKLDPKFWPDPSAMVKELEEMGVRIMISPWILVDQKSENYEEMKKKRMFIGSFDGKKDTVKFGGIKGENINKYQYDPTNPEAAEFLWRKWKENYFDIGIRTFWLDPCDDLHEIVDYDQVSFHIGSAKEVHCFYSVAHQKNIYDGLRAAGENEVVTICRSSWAGSQRYGASPAAHDIMSSFEHLERYMKAGLNLAMSGIPWGASEIGGFYTPGEPENYCQFWESDLFRELIVRWYQYAVFTPVFRTHGNRLKNEAWSFGGDTFHHIKSSMILREHLRPYIMEQMKIASKKGIPPMRPLFFDFNHDPEVYKIENEFLFGPEILVAPITKFKDRERRVYLPKGARWTEVLTGNSFIGGSTINVRAPIKQIPIFIRDKNPVLLNLISFK